MDQTTVITYTGGPQNGSGQRNYPNGRVSADSIRTRSTACGFSTRKLGLTDSDFNPYNR